MPPRSKNVLEVSGRVGPTEPVTSVSRAPSEPVPPGPHQLEIRIDGKIKFLQRVHSVTIDQQDDQATIVGVLKLPVSEPDV